MLRHPILLTAEGGGYAQSKALFAQQHVSAVAGVDGHYGIVLGEVDDVSLLGIQLRLGVQSLDVIGAVAYGVEHGLADAGHDRHGYHDINAVGELDAVLGKIGAHNAHGIGDNIHGAALHGTVVNLVKLLVHFLRIHPVIGGARVLLTLRADKCTTLNAGDVVDVGAVQHAAGELFLVELYKLACADSLLTELLELFLGAVDPEDLIGLCKCGHFIDPLQNVDIIGQFHGVSSIYIIIFITNNTSIKTTISGTS